MPPSRAFHSESLKTRKAPCRLRRVSTLSSQYRLNRSWIRLRACQVSLDHPPAYFSAETRGLRAGAIPCLPTATRLPCSLRPCRRQAVIFCIGLLRSDKKVAQCGGAVPLPVVDEISKRSAVMHVRNNGCVDLQACSGCPSLRPSKPLDR